MTAGLRRLLVVDRDWESYERWLHKGYPELEVIATPSFAKVESELAETEILVTMGVPLPGIDFTPQIAGQMPKLEWVQSLISGTERMRVALTGRDDVMITTVAGIHGPQMSEMALTHMLALGRGLRTIMHNQDAQVWQRVPQRILESKSVGIVGMGAVGTHLARICAAFGMEVHAFTRTERAIEGVSHLHGRDQLSAVVGDLDFLVLVLPAGDDTRHLVDAELLAAMRSTAYLVNLGRGSVVDEAALVAALQQGTIAGAGLDVFAVEPLPADSPLWTLDNAIITPHLGGHHDRSAEQAFTVLDRNLRMFLDGRRSEMVNVAFAGSARSAPSGPTL